MYTRDIYGGKGGYSCSEDIGSEMAPCLCLDCGLHLCIDGV